MFWMTKFGPRNPAKNIFVLLDHLQRQRKDEHHFRGQNRYYPHNAPSAVRAAAELGSATPKWVPISGTHWTKTSMREQARSDLRVVMMNYWGPAIGNILSQQYGVTSDGYDITADPEIAAFFATRKYPRYEPLMPTASTPLGVIYRFTIENQSKLDLGTVNNVLAAYGYFDMRLGSWIYFAQTINPQGIRMFADRQGAPLSVDDLVKSMNSPVCHRELQKVESRFRNDAITALFNASISAIPLPFAPDRPVLTAVDVPAGSLGQLEFNCSRTAHQKGGVYFPSFRHNAIVPQNPALHRMDATRSAAIPPLAILESATHVQELNSLRSVETFFFMHDATCKVDGFVPSHLWPDRKTDVVYEAVCGLAEKCCRYYLDNVQVEANDLALGVVDPGYAP